MLDPAIYNKHQEVYIIYLKHSKNAPYQFEKYILHLVDNFVERYPFLTKINVVNYLTMELNSFATLFPEFAIFNKSDRLNQKSISIAKDLDSMIESIDQVSATNLQAFLANRVISLCNFFDIYLAIKDDGVSEIYSVDSDFHGYAERPFIIKNYIREVVVKSNRGANTVLLDNLIKVLEIEDAIGVPETSLMGQFELQSFITEDQLPEASQKLSYNWGRLLSFAWFLSLRDYHFENIKIKKGKFILCDNEIILSPKLAKSAYYGRKDPEFVQYIQESIIGTNLLPIRFPDKHESVHSHEKERNFYKNITSEIDSVIEGFEFQNNINSLNKDKVIEIIEKYLNNIKIRCVFRPTNFYAKLLWRASLSKTYFDSEPYDFKILNALNKFPKEYDWAYSKICESEKLQLELGSIPIFYHGNPEIDKFYNSITIQEIDENINIKLKNDQKNILKLCLSINKIPEKTKLSDDSFLLIKEYIAYQDKIVFKNTEDNLTRLLSLAYLPTTNEHIVGPLDDGLYNGIAGIFSVYPSLLKNNEITRLSNIFFAEIQSFKISKEGLSSGLAGIASVILSGQNKSSINLANRILALIKLQKDTPSISTGGIFDPKNGFIYAGLLASSVVAEQEHRLTLLVDNIAQDFNSQNLEGIDLGLAHGFVGSQFLRSWYINESGNISKSDDLIIWKRLIESEIMSKNGICSGIDGLALAVSKLQINYGGYESLSDAISSALLKAKPLANNWLCHGYLGQVWSRYIFDIAFHSNILSSFELKKRTYQIIDEVKQDLAHNKLMDLSLFNGAMGVMAIDKILNQEFKLSNSMHIFPSFV